MCSFRDRTDQPTRVIIKEKTNQPYRQRQKRPKFKQVRTGPNKPHYFIRFLTADTDSIVALTQNPPKKPLSLRNHPLTRIINLPVNTRTPPHRRNKPIKNFGSPRPGKLSSVNFFNFAVNSKKKKNCNSVLSDH